MGAVDEGRAIVAEGTPEAAWQRWPALQRLSAVTLDQLVPPGALVVVVTPHPDDEVLGCGGLLAMLAAAGRTVRVVAVTDGEASHPGSRRWPPQRLAARRRAESLAGLRRLGCMAPLMTHLACPDGQVGRHAATVAAALRALLQPGDRVVTTWALDGHPDHEATAVAVDDAARAVGAVAVQAPVWMWHWAAPGDPRVPWQRLHRLTLSADALARKRAAIAAHRTQLAPQDSGGPAVLRPFALERLLRPFEAFFIEAR